MTAMWLYCLPYALFCLTPLAMRCASWLLRHVHHIVRSPRHSPRVCASLRSSQSALHTMRCSVHHRCNDDDDPDDPFHERRGWEDGMGGPYTMLSRVDQDAFAAASLSEEMTQTHFGPIWARAPTLVQRAVQQRTSRNTNIPSQYNCQRGRDSVDREGEADAEAGLTAEEMHKRVLDSRKRAMQRNYRTYDEFLEAELGGGKGTQQSKVEEHVKDEVSASAPLDEQTSVSAQEMPDSQEDTEGAIVEEDGVEASIPLPNFMQSPFAEPMSTSTTTSSIQRRERLDGAKREAEVPAWLTRQVLQALGPAHGNEAIALTDPESWDTDTVLLFLRTFDPNAQADTAGVMDESMCDAFRLAAVDGHSLLQLTPPHLFRVLRRWHVRRREVLRRAWQAVQEKSATDGNGLNEQVLDAAVMADVMERGLPRLQETLTALTPELIQETILLSFHYGH